MPKDRQVAKYSYTHKNTHMDTLVPSVLNSLLPSFLNTLIYRNTLNTRKETNRDTQVQSHKHTRRYINTLQLHRSTEIAYTPHSHSVSRETHSQECPEWGQAGLGLMPCSRDETRKPSAPGAQGRGSAGEKNTHSFVPLPTPPHAAKPLGQANLDKKAIGMGG